MARSGLFYNKQSGGFSTVEDIGNSMGQRFYVDSGASDKGTSSGYGETPDAPFSTIEAAFSDSRVTANRGDLIYVSGRHTETISAAAGIDADKAGVKVVGLGWGDNRPTITFDTDTAADLDIDADDIMFKNFRFVVDVASLAAMIDVNSAGFTLEDCDFYGNDAADEAPDITIITAAAANRMTLRRCSFNYLGALDGTAITATPTECIRLVGADHALIEDCYISGDFTTSAINGITTASLDIQILRNRIHNIATENIAGIVDLVAGCNGVIGFNYGFMGYTVSLAAIIDPSSCAMIENYFSNVVTEAGGLVGTASA